MKQNELGAPEGANRDRKRVGRGYGSGHGKTSGRGQKGQGSRSGGNTRPGFEGGQLPLLRRMPYKRGFTSPFKKHYEIVNLAALEGIPAGAEVTPDSLLAMGLIDRRQATTEEFRVKLLGDGDIASALNVRLHRVSKGARAKIEAAGGTVEEIEPAAAAEEAS
ncbi:MAG: 50S ribosomal protein L15 [Chloroflexota bacterium]|nr:50S ribosomal protein L15 [Chloroflexota bacterium]